MAVNMLTLTFEADLRTESTPFRAQMGQQSYEPHGPLPMASQVFVTASSVTHMTSMLTLTSEADLRAEVALLRAQMEGQSNEPHGPVPMASQVFVIPALLCPL
jgi:hypothetical protein